ncbi:rod shape-determining protein [Candidatus Uhrbacteria bacterium RIFCSPLOWO2_01_FULL_53_9]|uniref:Cell shape-determining protein MreB n=3 Tax=Candidatus Uhriibacteriota TaxID=1752732 RepID=A0A1F7V010_9BACT|nr:MAG: rod shape-determining protein [Candidatus Uhrbacteria bacterium RIFCSPHIGHO2_02_FULL_53_13]OGL83378.1 MAG: rod shape-determining protein [Candidatus Uhrbacteria bacterium RIFCSPLOWO2_01_FULL_53_9]OGL90052.1 MAG: rod shape-determining protein [Candidatus Uhrbacteria bacterium RIFCSPLOWO2_02_FULL_53_10]
MFKRLLGKLSKDLGIDLGTANTLVYSQEKGIVINEPSVVAINQRTGQVLAVGRDARSMIDKTPPHIKTSRPLINGVISDFEVAERMLKYFIDLVHQETFTLVPRPRVVIGVPLEITEVERKAVEDAVLSAGAREVFLVEEPMAAAIGARLPVMEAVGNMIVDIGGGTTEVAVVSLGGVVTWKALFVAGDEMNRNIVQYAREQFGLLIGDRVAEEIKMKIGSAAPLGEPAVLPLRGRDLITGLPREVMVNDMQIRESLARSVKTIIENIKLTLETTPPELVADIYERGIVLAGGGALLHGLDSAIAKEIQIPVRIADDPLTCVVRGCGALLDQEALLEQLALPLATEEQPAYLMR